MEETWQQGLTRGAWLAHQISKLDRCNEHKCKETRLRMSAAWISSFSYLRSTVTLPSAKVPIPQWKTPGRAFAPSLTTATVDLKSSQVSTSHLMHMERVTWELWSSYVHLSTAQIKTKTRNVIMATQAAYQAKELALTRIHRPWATANELIQASNVTCLC